MENLIFSLNATVPIFLLMILESSFGNGPGRSCICIQNEHLRLSASPPRSVFSDLATVDFSQVWDVRFVLFCFFATLFSIALLAVLLSRI